jgi:glycosyltransferase involved in cell wall biosynthesis
LPVLSTDCHSGPREILDDGRYGSLVPVRDPEALAGAIVETLRHPLAPELLKQRAEQLSAGSLEAYREIMLGQAEASPPSEPGSAVEDFARRETASG